MPKASSSLTGGTGDVNPQQYKLEIPNGIGVFTPASQTVAGSKTQSFPLPISRLKQGNGRATVIELLKIRWNNAIQVSLNQAPHNAFYLVQAWLSTAKPTIVANPTVQSPFGATDGSVIDNINVTNQFGVVASGTVQGCSFDNETPNYHDLTDGAGHGILIATDNIWLTIQLTVGAIDAVAYSANGYASCSLFYRFKDVSLQEYIGIVQSQQTSG